MALLFKNNDKGTYFIVNTIDNKVEFISYKIANNFLRYAKILYLDVLVLPDYKTVQAFNKVVKSGALSGLDPIEQKSFWLTNYPEYFI